MRLGVFEKGISVVFVPSLRLFLGNTGCVPWYAKGECYEGFAVVEGEGVPLFRAGISGLGSSDSTAPLRPDLRSVAESLSADFIILRFLET